MASFTFKKLKEKFKSLLRTNIVEHRVTIINDQVIEGNLTPDEAKQLVKESDELFDAACKRMDALFEDVNQRLNSIHSKFRK